MVTTMFFFYCQWDLILSQKYQSMNYTIPPGKNGMTAWIGFLHPWAWHTRSIGLLLLLRTSAQVEHTDIFGLSSLNSILRGPSTTSLSEHCGVTLSDRFSFMSHERDVHKEKPNGVIIGTVPTISLYLGSETCPICNESYKTNKNLRNHLKYKHGYYIYHCQWCSEHKYFPKDIAEHVLESHHLPFMNPLLMLSE